MNCKAITAGESLDVIEIDGASNNGVENIRGLKENVTLAPFNSKWKIYIIDEVHMLSGGAFNALLKTLEEPPEYVIFIMATTEPQKVPVTIRSRCQHIPFHSIITEDIFSRLKYVSENEKVKANDEALWEISRQADGALRDALSLFEQVISAAGDKEITLSLVENVTGAGSRSAFERWIKTFRTEPAEAYIMLKSMFDAGASGLRVFEEIFALIRNLWLVSRWKNIADTLGSSEQERKFLIEEVQNWKTENLHRILSVTVRMLSEARRGMRNDILTGLFMFYLEGEQGNYSQCFMPQSLPERLDVKQNETVRKFEAEKLSAEVSEPKTKEYDALREKILERIHDENFLIYCAVREGDIFEDEKGINIRILYEYNYRFMRGSRRGSALRTMLKEYGEVILRYERESFRCVETEPETETETGYEAEFDAPVKPVSKNPERKSEPSRMPEYIPEEILFEPAENETSIFHQFIGELRRLNAMPEVLMISMNENETENETEIDGENNPDEGENNE